MRVISTLIAAWLCLGSWTTIQAGEDGFVPARSVYDKRFHRFVDAGVRVEILATGFGWAEGPVWVPSMRSLLFSDVAGDTVYRWREGEGVDVYLKPSGHPPDGSGHAWRGANGLAVDADGRLVLAQQGRRVLARMRSPLAMPAPDYAVLAEDFEGSRLNSPNDLLVDCDGAILFTDPPYGLAGFEQSPDKELAFSGVYRLSPNGELTLLDDSLEKPNGLALSSDRERLFISNSEPGEASVYVFDFDAATGAVKKRLFFDARALETTGEGSTDGMAMHPQDYLFVSLPGGFGVLSADGMLLGKIELGQVTNLAFDADYRYLYITGPDRLMRLAIDDPRD
jgi:gluconolactonase